jgi:hypothetical protein
VLHSFVSFELWGIAAPSCHSNCRLGLATPSYRLTRSCSTLALVSFDRWALGIGLLAPPCHSTWRCSVLHGLVSFDIAPLGCRTSASSEMSGLGSGAVVCEGGGPLVPSAAGLSFGLVHTSSSPPGCHLGRLAVVWLFLSSTLPFKAWALD